jgi:hypothetical protein
VFTVPYPYCRDSFEWFSDEHDILSTNKQSWRPGTESDSDGGYDVQEAADAMGSMVLTVVDVFKPGRYPARVFYTRQWIDPDGKVFGKSALRMTTVNAFLRRTKGYMHDFYLNGELYSETQK